MSDDTDRRTRLSATVGRLSTDLAAVLALVAATNVAVLAPVLGETPLRVVLGLPFVLFLPGYALLAALFPEAGESVAPSENDEDRAPSDGPGEPGWPARDWGINGIERVALSFGLSIAIVALLGMVVNYTPWGIRPVPVLVTVSGFTVGTTAVAALRRRHLPPEERFQVSFRDWIARGRTELFEPRTRGDAVLNVVLLVSILVAVAGVGYTVTGPETGERFTEFYLLTENESGALVAGDYPHNFTAGEGRSVHVAVTNNEHRRTNYTVVVLIQDVRVGNDSTTVLRERELDRYRLRLAHNETWLRQRRVAPTLVGERLRLTFLLYRGDPPSDPTVENADQELHLRVNVTEPDGSVRIRSTEQGASPRI